MLYSRSLSLVFFFCLMLLPFQRVQGQVAAPAKPVVSKFSLASHKTSDSVVEVRGTLSDRVQWVWVRAIKKNQMRESMLKAEARNFELKSYLPFGPGKYFIEVYVTTEKSEYGNFYRLSKFEVENTDERADLEVLLPETGIPSDSQTILELANTITAGLSTELEKTTAIYSWVTQNIAYDTVSYLNGTYALGEHGPLSVLEKKIAVCEGYSNLTIALNRAAGIKARKVAGEGILEGETFKGVENHAWVEVNVDGRWMSQDPTWDSGHVTLTGEFLPDPRKDFFDADPAVFAESHRPTKP